MYFVPLNQVESVELVVHALRAAGGQADCSHCPARKVCMQQCLSIADGIAEMLRAGTLPQLASPEPPPEGPGSDAGSGPGRRLRVIK